MSHDTLDAVPNESSPPLLLPFSYWRPFLCNPKKKEETINQQKEWRRCFFFYPGLKTKEQRLNSIHSDIRSYFLGVFSRFGLR
jgi:hypothetical protein